MIAETFCRIGRAITSPSAPASTPRIHSRGFTGYFSAACTIPKQKKPRQRKTLRLVMHSFFIFLSFGYYLVDFDTFDKIFPSTEGSIGGRFLLVKGYYGCKALYHLLVFQFLY